MTDATLAERLALPLDPKRVHKREGSGGRQLSYLEAHDVVRTANGIFGVGEWSYQTKELTCLGEEATRSRDGKEGFRVAYRAVVQVIAGGSSFADVGYGDAVEYTGSRLTPHELAAKEAVSDAVKRCMKNYGDQFGLCLYDKAAPEHRGQNGHGSFAQPASVPPAVSSPGVTAPTGMVLAGDVVCPLGKNKGTPARALSRSSLKWYAGEEFNPTHMDGVMFKRAAQAFLADSDATVPAQEDEIPF